MDDFQGPAWEEVDHRLGQIIDASPLPTFVLAEDHTVTHWNRACADLSGVEAEAMVGTRDAWRAFYASPRPVLANLVLDGADAEVVASFYGGKAGQSAGPRGGWAGVDIYSPERKKWFSLTAVPLFNRSGRIAGALQIVRDITADKYYAHELEYRSTHDGLTDLPNRTLLTDRLDHALRVAERSRRPVGVVYIGLDGFKLVNEAFGHTIGDQLLKEAALRLKGCVRDGDTVARFGGDEFVILPAETPNRQTLAALAERCIEAIAAPFQLQGHDLSVTASVGLSLYPENGLNGTLLLNGARSAMHLVKASRNGGGHLFFDGSVGREARERATMRSALVKALGRREFLLHYQAKGRLSDGCITGFEALLRWMPTSIGTVSPAKFIPLLEESGQIVEVGEWVVAESVRQSLRWKALGLTAAVNISARQLWQPDLPERIARILEEQGARPEILELEITESMLMQDPEQAIRTLRALSDMGVHLSLDDFGTGYSSLSYLKRFPIGTIKVDRSFVSEVTTNRDDLEIVRAIVTMARSLGRRTIAEGVETTEQRRILADLGCDEIQGYLLSRPLPEKEFAVFLQNRK